MPAVTLLLYRNLEDRVPVLDFLDDLPVPARRVMRARLELLAQRGHEMRRPHADLLRDGIYELRVREGNIHYRVLYAFCGRTAVLLTHGFTKEREVPSIEIDRALQMRAAFDRNPERHHLEVDL